MEEVKKEKEIKNSPNPVSIQGTKTILFQMQNCICKIIKSDGITGTGFFCKIPFKTNLLPVLITNNHVLSENDIEINKIIEFTINDDNIKGEIKIDDKRIVNSYKELDVTIIEIRPNKDKINNFLELDEDINKEENILKTIYKKKSIYILHYPKGDNAQVSYGLLKEKENNELNHYCSTETGSSGSPILSLKSFKVIGIHYGASIFEFNKGTFIKYVINKFIKQKKNIDLKNNNDINKNKDNF